MIFGDEAVGVIRLDEVRGWDPSDGISALITSDIKGLVP